MHQAVFVVLSRNKDDRVISHNENHRFPIFSSRHLPPTDASVNVVRKTTLKIIDWLNNFLGKKFENTPFPLICSNKANSISVHVFSFTKK